MRPRSKTMFKRILVPLDESARAEQVLPIAARIVRASGGTVMLLHIVTTPIEFGPYLRPSAVLGEAVHPELAPPTKNPSNDGQMPGLARPRTKQRSYSRSTAPNM